MVKKSVNEYFSSLTNEKTVPETTPTSTQEQDYLFNDPLSEVDNFIRLEELKIKVQKSRSHTAMKVENSKLAFKFSLWWAIFIGIIILLYGFGGNYKFFKMSESEFMFITGSLTFSILAFYSTVLRYLFYRKPVKK